MNGIDKLKGVYQRMGTEKQQKLMETYEALTGQEKEANYPLQIILMGVFDAIMVDLMNGIDKLKGTDWQDLRTSICDGLKSRRNDRVLEILKATHFNAHVIFLQEAGIQLVDLISRTMSG